MLEDSADVQLAIVVPSLTVGGGVPTVADFVYSVFSGSPRYNVDLISLATSRSDPTSVRLLRPSSWVRGVQIQDGTWRDRAFKHVGANIVELEFFRFLPRQALTNLLNTYDAVFIVSGTPAWAYPTKGVAVPVLLQTATLAKVERRRQRSVGRGLTAWWRNAMTLITDKLDSKGILTSDMILVENPWMYDFVKNLVGADRVQYTPPGVNTHAFSPATEKVTSEPYILSVGRFSDPRKNVPFLFRAYANLLETHPNAPRLVLAGSTGPTASDWELADHLGVRQRVEHKHNVSKAELIELYKQATLFALGSDEEGLGMVILEAMACGVPVVSTRSGGPDGIISDGKDGFLVPLGEPEAFASSMATLIDHEELRNQIGRAARTTVELRFSQEVTGTQFIQAIEHIMKQGTMGDGKTPSSRLGS